MKAIIAQIVLGLALFGLVVLLLINVSGVEGMLRNPGFWILAFTALLWLVHCYNQIIQHYQDKEAHGKWLNEYLSKQKRGF